MSVLACLWGSLVSSDAKASAFSVYGFGPEGVAEVGARAARVEDGSAAYYNPGGLGLGHGTRLSLSPTLGVSALQVQHQTLALQDPFGIALAFDATVPLEGPLKDRIRFGFGGYVLPTSVLRLLAKHAEQPLFPYFDNRTQRLVLIPALSVRVTDALALGVGADFLGGVKGPAEVKKGASNALESRIDVDATTVVALHAGIRFDPAKHVRLALVYRQQMGIPATITTSAEVGGTPLDVAVNLGQALYDPHTLVVGSSFDLGPASVEVDASYSVWSIYKGPFLDATATLPGVNLVSQPLPPLFRDVVSVRVAATYQIGLAPTSTFMIRAGGGFEPSMMTGARQGKTNLVDGNKTLVGLGGTWFVRDLLPVAFHVGLGVNATLVSSFEQAKRVCTTQPCGLDTVTGPDGSNPGAGVTNPGYPKLQSGGALWSAALGIGVEL